MVALVLDDVLQGGQTGQTSGLYLDVALFIGETDR